MQTKHGSIRVSYPGIFMFIVNFMYSSGCGGSGKISGSGLQWAPNACFLGMSGYKYLRVSMSLTLFAKERILKSLSENGARLQMYTPLLWAVTSAVYETCSTKSSSYMYYDWIRLHKYNKPINNAKSTWQCNTYNYIYELSTHCGHNFTWQHNIN